MIDVLIAYGSKRGSTREVAEAVGATLRERGLEVEVSPAGGVDDITGYRSVVLGGSLYIGRWHPDARRFLRRYRRSLAETPFAVFALGPVSDREEDRLGSRSELDRALAQIPEAVPAAVEVFGGVIDPAKLHFPFNRMPAGDYRDQEAIRKWAAALPGTLGLARHDEPAAVR